MKPLVDFVEDPQDEESVDPIPLEDIREAVVYSADWTTETILAQLRRGNIQINPSFQRRDAWNRKRKSRFIESLILGLPVPQIVLAERREQKGQYIVLDGKQRLLSLLQFTGAAEASRFNGFALQGLDVRDDLNRKSFHDLSNDLILGSDYDAFLNQTVRAVVIRNWPSYDFLHLVFVRLNSGHVSLSPQELREALFPGPFVDFVDARAAESEPLMALLKIDEPDFRMRDVEILVRFLGFAFFLPEYTGNLKAFLDSTCDKLNKAWGEHEDEIRGRANAFDLALATAIEIFGADGAARKWVGDRFEGRLNRAVLDVMAFYFADELIRTAALERRGEVISAFQNLCETDDFRSAIETTTKSMTATRIRFERWGLVLRDVVALPFRVPYADDPQDVFAGFWQ